MALISKQTKIVFAVANASVDLVRNGYRSDRTLAFHLRAVSIIFAVDSDHLATDAQ